MPKTTSMLENKEFRVFRDVLVSLLARLNIDYYLPTEAEITQILQRALRTSRTVGVKKQEGLTVWLEHARLKVSLDINGCNKYGEPLSIEFVTNSGYQFHYELSEGIFDIGYSLEYDNSHSIKRKVDDYFLAIFHKFKQLRKITSNADPVGNQFPLI